MIQLWHHWSLEDYLKHETDEVPQEEYEALQRALYQFVDYYPPQYIAQEAEFYHRYFKVTDDVLIPRVETAEIVAEILNREADTPQTVVDLGCGSGCIGITLKKEHPQFEVTLLDISQKALAIAKANARRFDVEVQCIESDLLAHYNGRPIDIFISNPPYISEDEYDVMDESVKRYEPETALYAKHQGLWIYEQLAQYLPNYMSEDGRIYLEIGYLQGRAVKALFESAFPNHDVSIQKDSYGNDRLICVERKKS